MADPQPGDSPLASDSEEFGGCVMCAGADPAACTPLQRMLPPGRSRIIARSEHLVAVPTFGCFIAGYLLVVPQAHVTSFGCLDTSTLSEAGSFITTLAGRIAAVYGTPVLGFEYGNNMPAGRRIEHAHWHLLPSAADLPGWLSGRLAGHPISTLAELPSSPDASYIAVRSQQGELTVYPVANEPVQRLRLRRLVAELDPRVDQARWDWVAHNFPDLIRRTVADLGADGPAGDAT